MKVVWLMKKMKNDKWKRRFLLLAIVNGAILLLLIFYFYSPVPRVDIEYERQAYKEEESSQFIVRTTKKNVTNLVYAYLDQVLQNTDHQFYVELDEDVKLFGEIPIFSTTVPLYIRFEPVVYENGDIALKQKSISVGELKLPNKKIMQYIDKYLPTPKWVIINPREQEIYVQVTEMDIKSNFQVAVQQFDLEANNLSFKFDVPYKTLGIDILEESEKSIDE